MSGKNTVQDMSAAGFTPYQRAVNYLAAAQVYLKSDALLEHPLKHSDIKDRLLGHWGTCPGINLVYSHINRIIKERDLSILLVTGPGHGSAANLANMYLDGSLAKFYPQYRHGKDGLEAFVKAFSWPGGFPSHLFPGLPGVIHEGGELGYALATAFGSVMDNPSLTTVCIVGDGEAETGPTAGAWHSAKFLNPKTDGAVLPVVHLNGFKISNPTLMASMTDQEIKDFFSGLGWNAYIVNYSDAINADLAKAMDQSFDEIAALKKNPPERTIYPVIVLRTPKGVTGPEEVDGKPAAGSFRSHQVPAKEARTNPRHLKILENWLKSYKPEELFTPEGFPSPAVLAGIPAAGKTVAENPHAIGGNMRIPLIMPSLEQYALTGRRGSVESGMEKFGQWLAELIALNEKNRNFRIFCPDELESNRIGAVLEKTSRQFYWPVPKNAEHIAQYGRIMEVLSEHNCQGWLQGYLLTGRHGLFPCYEAFISIIDGMINQYAKFLKTSMETPWRPPVSSLNYLLTSEAWRQDHNGYSHQGPGFINNLLTKKGHTYRLYFPPDGNCLISTMAHCFGKTNCINLVVAGKQPAPQWLSMDEAIQHCRIGMSIWRWAGTNGGENPDLVLAGCGDNLTTEVLAASRLLKEDAPDWNIRVVNVVRLMTMGIPHKYPSGMEEEEFRRIFPYEVPVIFNFHGYTAAVKQLLWERPGSARFHINGYREEGTTTTPFDMHIRNRTSRWHLVIEAAFRMAKRNPAVSALAEEIIRKYERKIREHEVFIRENGHDPEEITEWQWK